MYQLSILLMQTLPQRNLVEDLQLLGSPENHQASEKCGSSWGFKWLLMIQSYKTVKIPHSQKRPVIYCLFFSTKLQETGDGSLQVICLLFTNAIMIVYFGTITVVCGLPKFNYVQDASKRDEYNHHQYFQESWFLSWTTSKGEEFFRKHVKASFEHLQGWRFLSFFGHLFQCWTTIGDFFFFLICGQDLLCSLLLYISTEENQFLPSISKLLLHKTANTNHFSWKALNVK